MNPRSCRDPRIAAEPARHSRGLCIPPPLPTGDRGVHDANATAGGGRAGALRGLFPPRQGKSRAVIQGRGPMSEPLLAFEGVSRAFTTRRGRILAVDDVSLDLGQGEILCLVGESGSGKTTMARMAAGLPQPTAARCCFEGQDITMLPKAEFKAVPPRRPDRPPGPLRLAEPDPHHRRDAPRSAAAPSSSCARAAGDRAGGGTARNSSI